MEHQPFLFFRDELKLLFCRYTDKKTMFFGGSYTIDPWRIHFKTKDDIKEVNTLRYHEDLGEAIVECNPHIVQNNGEYIFGYSGGFCNGPDHPVIYSYITAKIDLDTMDTTNFNVGITPAFSASSINGDLFWAQKTPINDLLLKNGLSIAQDLNIRFIYRICPIFGQDDKLIITFDKSPQNYNSWIISTDGQPIKEIKNKNGDPVYKCSIYGDTLIYSTKDGEKRSLITEEYEQ